MLSRTFEGRKRSSLSARQRLDQDAAIAAAANPSQSRLLAGKLGFVPVKSSQFRVLQQLQFDKTEVEESPSKRKAVGSERRSSDAEAVPLSTLKRAAMQAEGVDILVRRIQYSVEEKDFALRMLEAADTIRHGAHAGQRDKSKTAKLLREKYFWDPTGTNRQMLQRFLVSKAKAIGPKATIGRPVNREFELALRNCIIAEHADVSTGEYKISSPVHSAQTVVSIARWLRNSDARFSADASLARLQFEWTWYKGFTKRSRLSMRKVTSDTKADVDWKAAAETMQALQVRIRLAGYQPEEVGNADEMAVYFATSAPQQLTTTDSSRTAAPGYHNSARVTAMLTSLSSGASIPHFIIAKSSFSRADMTGMKVHSTIGHGFEVIASEQMTSLKAGGVERIWERTLVMPARKGQTPAPQLFRIPYWEFEDGSVVTANDKAWMKTQYCAMWLEVVVKGYMDRHGLKRFALVWDNCGPHKTKAVTDLAKELNIDLLMLYPNTTSKYQVQDAVVNSLVKKAFWAARGADCAEQFGAWRAQHKTALDTNATFTRMYREALATATPDKRKQVVMPPLLPVPSWNPPTVSTAKGAFLILTALQCLKTPDAVSSIRRCFERLGLKEAEGKWLRCLPSTEASKSHKSLQDPDQDIDHIAHGALCHFGEISSAAIDVVDCTVDAATAAELA